MKFDFRIRIPTQKEWSILMDITGQRTLWTHWHYIYSWIQEIGVERKDRRLRACRGYYAARHWTYADMALRTDEIGFRPVLVPLSPDTEIPGAGKFRNIPDGTTLKLGTLYMDDEPVHVPECSVFDGDVEDYIPGALLQMKNDGQSLDYQPSFLKVGDVLIADRNLLKNISWVDLAMQGFCDFPISAPEKWDITELYRQIAKEIGYEVTENTKFGCTKVLVAKDIQDHVFSYYEGLGYDECSIGMMWCCSGPKVERSLEPNHVRIFPGFFVEEPAASSLPFSFNLNEAIRNLLEKSDETVLEGIASTLMDEANNDEEPYDKMAQAMLEAYLNGDVDGFCIALTGWSFENILKKSGAIEDYDHTFE